MTAKSPDVDEVAGRLREAAQYHLTCRDHFATYEDVRAESAHQHGAYAEDIAEAAALLLSQAERVKALEGAVKEIISLAQSERSDPIAETPRELRAILNRIEWAARYSPAGDLYRAARLSSQGEG